ncbi:MAG: hypothetical protein N3B21_12990 [Clostridia bacterium]|nr:hypothetical protein [Clostridia bacterium]
MKVKCITIAVLIFALCTSAGCSKQTLQFEDNVIPPIPANIVEINKLIPGTSSNNSNVGALVLPSSNMVYTLLDKTNAPVSIYADNKYLYLLRCAENTNVMPDTASNGMEKYGNVIEVYDVENASLLRKISNKALERCSAFTVKESNLYAFDVKTGRILLFSSNGGFLSAYDTGLSGYYVEKLVVAGEQRIVMKIREKAGEGSQLAILNADSKKAKKVKVQQLLFSPSDQNSEINDFCLYRENLILVNISSGAISLFDIKDVVPKKVSAFPNASRYVEFDGNVLYYSSDELVNLIPANTANFSNARLPKHTGRVLINSEFPWPQTVEELGDWLLNDLDIPFANHSSRHYGMAQNNKYLFFLDFISTQSKGDRSTGSDFIVYRIVK